MSTRSSYPSQSAQASRSAQAMRSTSAQQYGPAQVPLPARPLARVLLLALQSWPGITNDECATGWAGALRSVCTRPALIAVTGDGFGVTPPTNGSKTRPPVVVVAQYLQKHLVRELAAQQPTEVVSGYRGDTPVMSPASSLSAQCIPAATFKAGVYGLWQSGGKSALSPRQRVGEWPDLVVQVGIAPPLPQDYPVPLVLAPVDWSDPEIAAHTLALRCARELSTERSVLLAMNAAAGSGFQTETLELMLRRTNG